MQVFISWSGERSRQIADALRNWLPDVIQGVRPWMSDEDISPGSRWLNELSEVLNRTRIGILCVTPENQHNPWLQFEAGALSRTVAQTFVCPLLFDMTPEQLTGPLTQFQANGFCLDGVGKVVAAVNRELGERGLDACQLERVLNVWWPKLNEKLEKIGPATAQGSTRSTSEKLEELLALSRESLRSENLSLEAARERDVKLDRAIEMLTRLTAAMDNGRKRAESHRPQVEKQLEPAIVSGAVKAEIGAQEHADFLEAPDQFLMTGGTSEHLVAQVIEMFRRIQAKDRN